MREFLEKNHEDAMDKEQTIKLAIKSLLEVVQTGAKSAFSKVERFHCCQSLTMVLCRH